MKIDNWQENQYSRKEVVTFWVAILIPVATCILTAIMVMLYK